MASSQKLLEPLTDREREILSLLAEGLTNHEIAEELFLTHGTVKWYNRQIYSKLGVNSRAQAVRRVQEEKLLEPDETTSALVEPTHQLPSPASPLIGRRQQIDDLQRLMREYRLVTLTGAGGSGKTRLAVELAWLLHHDFSDGVAYVDLAPASSAERVAAVIAACVEVFENAGEDVIDTLKRALRQREMLLVIDNFEHVVAAAPVVGELLAASPQLKILVTSREALRLTGEQEYPVPPLSLPTGDAPAAALERSEAAAFFVQRARMLRPDFTLADDNAPAIAEICIRLDGLPLALELAAARCKVLSPQALLDRLENRLGTLTSGARDLPARQQTLRATLEWSYHLLDEAEKRLFARLAVFRGGRSLDAIEAICGEGLSAEVFETLAGLVDKNLIYRKESLGGEPRFWMLETIHEYAWECLEASGEADNLRQRHAEYFVALAERAKPQLRLAQQAYWFQLLEVEQDNLRAVLDWSLSGGNDVILGLRLVGAQWLFWWAYGPHVEAQSWIEQLLTYVDTTPQRYHPPFLFAAGAFAQLRDKAKSRQFFERVVELSRRLGDRFHAAWALIYMGHTVSGETAFAKAEEGLALFRELDYKPGIAQALNNIGELARVAGEDENAKAAYQECITLCEQIGEIRLLYSALYNRAFISQHEGDHQGAIDLLRRSITLSRDMKIKSDMAMAMQILAGSLAAIGQPEHAARLFGAVELALERLGAILQPSDLPELERNIVAVRSQLDNDTFLAAWDAGRQMTLEQAVADALDEGG